MDVPRVFAGAVESQEFLQNILFMRHGDRIDHFEPLWIPNAARPWDPPLTDAGKSRAWCTGKRIRREGYQINRVFVSPFLRCLQTAAEVVLALCAVDDDPSEITSQNAVIDPTRVNVSIEYGLCELMSRRVGIEGPPKDGNWFLNIPEIEAIIPAGTMDHLTEPVYSEPPRWEEDLEDARERYRNTVISLANRYPRENLLLLSHGEGVGVAVTAFTRDSIVYEIDYCAYAHLQRRVTWSSEQQPFAGEIQLLTRNAQTGIRFLC